MKKKAFHAGEFLFALFLNLLMNIAGTIPAIVLLICHFLFGLPLWIAVSAFLLWIICILIRMAAIRWASSCSNMPEPKCENKNPYSVGYPKKPIRTEKQNASKGETSGGSMERRYE